MNRVARPLLLCAVLDVSVMWMPGDVVTIEQADGQRSSFDHSSVDISADGRYVAFTSLARLVSADTNETRDIYVLDRVTGRVMLEVFEFGGSVGKHSDSPDLSADGRFLVYETHLLSENTEPLNIVLRDRQGGAARILSRGLSGEPANGDSRMPSIAADGSVVAFTSAATNLIAAIDTNGASEDVYAMDLSTGIVRRVSEPPAMGPASSGPSHSPSVSGTGRYLAFVSSADLRVSDVYVHDASLRTMRRVSVGPRGMRANGSSFGPAISENGRHIAFVSKASNLVAGDGNELPDVFVADWHDGSVELVSRTAAGRSANDVSYNPAISADGRYVAFQSEASNLVCAGRCAGQTEDINLLSDVFLLDRKVRSMMRVSGDANGPWMEASIGPALDAMARVVALSSRHPMHGADRHNDFDLFIVTR